MNYNNSHITDNIFNFVTTVKTLFNIKYVKRFRCLCSYG